MLVSITEIFVPFMARAEVSLVQVMPGERSVRNCRVNPLSGAGQEICTRLLLVKFAMERNGKGQTVVTSCAESLAGFGSRESVSTVAELVMGPVAVGVTVSVTV